MNRVSLAAAAFVIASAASAQCAPVDHYTTADIMAEMAKLKPGAAASGSASESLQRYTNHFTMVAYRDKDGGAELHQTLADVFFVVHGKATLVTGGSMPDAKEVSPGELRGPAVSGGDRMTLSEGDVVHIPSGTPHQILVAPGEEFLYFMVKVKDRD